MRVSFGEWLPDLPAVSNPGLLEAYNCVPARVGYGPMPKFVQTPFDAISDRCRGSIAVIDESAIPFVFAGTGTKLHRLGPSGTQDVSQAGDYALAAEARWELIKFGEDVLAVSLDHNPQFFNLGTSALFADLPGAPKAKHAGVIGNQVFLGNLDDAVAGRMPNGVHWSASDNMFGWPTPGSDAAAAVLSGRRELRGNGGRVQVVAGGAEVGAVFQESVIWRVDFVGGDVMYEFIPVEPDFGSLIPGLAVPFGRRIFYIHSDGVRTFNYSSSDPIGHERVDRFLLGDLDQAYLARVSFASDPRSKRIAIAYPGAGNTAGLPNRILLWDWGLDKFSLVNVEIEALANAAPQGTHLDAMTEPSIDDMVTSFDTPQASAKDLTFGAFDAMHKLGQFSGAGMDATFTTGDIEHAPGKRSFVQGVRPIVDGASATAAVAPKGTRQDATIFGDQIVQTVATGLCDMRADGRYHRYRIAAPSGWESCVGIEVEVEEAGMR